MTMETSRNFAKASLLRAEKALRSAKILLDHDEVEDSVSRAYYAMFHAAKAILFTKGVKAKTHKGVISSFSENIVKKSILGKEFADILRKAFDMRQRCDYEIYAKLEKELVKEVVSDAENFVNKIRELMK